MTNTAGILNAHLASAVPLDLFTGSIIGAGSINYGGTRPTDHQ